MVIHGDMQMFERHYLLNPFLLKTSSDEELSKQINKMVATYRKTDIMADVAYNINLESDLLMIYGEFIARLQEEYSLVKLQADNQEAKAIYQLRNDWEKTNTGKTPSIEYFKAQASDLVKDLREKQYKAESMLTRFKKAYSSLETKQNALKKKLDVMRFEEGGNL